MPFLNPDGTKLQWCNETLLAVGANAVVVRHGSHALKIPKIYSSERQNEEKDWQIRCSNESTRAEFEVEKAVYQRVGKCDGIARCIDISDKGILLALYQRGDLEDYIKNEPQVGESRKAEWILSLIKTELHFHDRKVLISDHALRNILLADDLSLKMIDFGQCSLLSLDANIDKIDKDGLTTQVDIFHLGNIIYSIATWENYEYDYFWNDLTWPSASDLPDLQGVFCSKLIEKCWSRKCSSMRQLHDEHYQDLINIARGSTSDFPNSLSTPREQDQFSQNLSLFLVHRQSVMNRLKDLLHLVFRQAWYTLGFVARIGSKLTIGATPQWVRNRFVNSIGQDKQK